MNKSRCLASLSPYLLIFLFRFLSVSALIQLPATLVSLLLAMFPFTFGPTVPPEEAAGFALISGLFIFLGRLFR